MNKSNILKLVSSAGMITQQVTANILDRGQDFIEDKMLKGHYATREEFEQLKTVVIKLQQELDALKINNNQ